MSEVMPFLRRVTAVVTCPGSASSWSHSTTTPVTGLADQRTEPAADRRLDRAIRPGRPQRLLGQPDSPPWLTDAFQQMVDAGVTRAITVFTSAYSSYSGCRQYRENLAEAMDTVPRSTW